MNTSAPLGRVTMRTVPSTAAAGAAGATGSSGVAEGNPRSSSARPAPMPPAISSRPQPSGSRCDGVRRGTRGGGVWAATGAVGRTGGRSRTIGGSAGCPVRRRNSSDDSLRNSETNGSSPGLFPLAAPWPTAGRLFGLPLRASLPLGQRGARSLSESRRPRQSRVRPPTPGCDIVRPVRITLLTNEYPPNVYGGAGVHIEYLSRELAALDDRQHQVRVLCFRHQRTDAGNQHVQGLHQAARIAARDPRHERFFDTAIRNLQMAADPHDTDIVHCHTWYTHFAGCLVQQLADVPLVLTTHSLEPHRPWKAEQLGSAYQASSWVERTAYQNADGVIAVSEAMRRDVHQLY